MSQFLKTPFTIFLSQGKGYGYSAREHIILLNCYFTDYLIDKDLIIFLL